MERVHLLHLVFIAVWRGVIAVEVVFEVLLRGSDGARRIAAQLHFWTDLLVEGPLLLGIVVTGGLLLARAWPPSTLHVIKLVGALTALAANTWCITQVTIRLRHVTNSEKLVRYQRRVFLSGLAIPFGLIAAYIGFVYFVPIHIGH